MKEHLVNIKELSGSASWLPILGASLFWAWMDRAMFGDALYTIIAEVATSEGVSHIASQQVFVAMLAASAVTCIIAACKFRDDSGDVFRWHAKTVCSWAMAGLIGNAFVFFFGGISTILTLAGAVISGASMSALMIAWGRICIAQGPTKAMAHISGAWALGLAINAVMEALFPIARSAVVMFLPLASAGLYAMDSSLQQKPLHTIERQEPVDGLLSKCRILDIDGRFLLFIFVFCSAFGLMCSFEIFTPADALHKSAFDIVGMRGVTALFFFAVGRTALSKHMEWTFNACLSFMVVGLAAMTLGFTSSDLQPLARIFIPIGYAAFDILVWSMMGLFSREEKASAGRIVAVAMGVEQAGILFGEILGIFLGSHTTSLEPPAFLILSYALILVVAGYIRFCAALWQEDVSEGEGGPVVVEGTEHLSLFADEKGLTAREQEVFALFQEGRSVPYIAKALFLSENTVKTHVRHIYTKCGIHNRQELLDAISAFKRRES